MGEKDVTCTDAGLCVNVAKRAKRSVPPRSGSPTPRRDDNHQAANAQTAREAAKMRRAVLAAYEREFDAFTRCINTSLDKAVCGSGPVPPQFGSDTMSSRGNGIPISAGQAAAIAVARLQLPTVAPGIGPSPDLNPWNIAAVGYPLWLWADGPTHVGPVSDSVGGLSVSLDAEVTNLTFRMGDGHEVTCAGTGRPWTAAVQPGTKSPSCGYSYTRPSLPDGSYKVRAIANWAVTWTSNGQSGVINVPVVDTTELPVGELQVLVR
jgi:hypothetical protein